VTSEAVPGDRERAPAPLAKAQMNDRPSTAPSVEEAGALVNTIPSRRLDFLRGVAAVYVVIGHVRGTLFAGGQTLTSTRSLDWLDYVQLAMLQATSLGTEAVILFFVLSGFAMAHSMRYARSTKSFYVKRLIRIWPPYLLAVALAFTIALLILRTSAPNVVKDHINSTNWRFVDFLGMAFYTRIDTVLTAQFWSLPQEVLFYIACPLLLAGLHRARLFWRISIVLTIVSVLVFGIYDGPEDGSGIVCLQFLKLLIFFMTGAMAYYFQHRIPTVRPRLLLVITVAYLIVVWAFKYRVLHGWNLFTSLMTIPLALMLLKNVPAKIYNCKPLNWGHFSYSIYLFHLQFIILISFFINRLYGLKQTDITSYWAWTLAVPPVLFACWLLYFVSEKPSSDLLARWRDRDRRRDDPVTPS
jgi:peptidoglycan/LPS O-acetylase OafA/YrhL